MLTNHLFQSTPHLRTPIQPNPQHDLQRTVHLPRLHPTLHQQHTDLVLRPRFPPYRRQTHKRQLNLLRIIQIQYRLGPTHAIIAGQYRPTRDRRQHTWHRHTRIHKRNARSIQTCTQQPPIETQYRQTNQDTAPWIQMRK